MMDTNQFNQGIVVAQQVQANWPMICAAAVIVSRELRNFNVWLKAVMEWVISHGGFGWILWKLVWNPPVKPETKCST